MSQEVLIENIEKHLKAIDVCLEQHLRMPALILIYSGIDIFASLSIPRAKSKATRQDYIDWCEKYVLANRNIGCKGIDLYAARCGVVHSYTMDSKLSDEGKANAIVYSWGSAQPGTLQEAIDKAGLSAVVIHMDSLAAAFREGVATFLTELDTDNEKAELVINRARKLFNERPKEKWY